MPQGIESSNLSVSALAFLLDMWHCFATMKKHIILSLLTLILGLSVFLVPQGVEARIDSHGFYFVEDDVYNIHYMAELAGANNTIKLAYNNLNSNPQVLADKLRANGYTKLELTIYLEEAQFLNTNGARDAYLQAIKKKLYQDSNLGQMLTGIHILEEPYTLIRHGYFDSWTIFQGKSLQQRDAMMKSGLESYISSIKSVFPGVPTIIVENYWGHSFVPPSNLDILGVDAYYVPTSSACDATQKAKFDSEVTNLINLAKQYGKPIQMVGGVFDASNYYKMPSLCQAQWYIDLAKYTPEVTSFHWFLYATVDGVGGARNHSSGIIEYLKSEGRKIVTEYNTGTQPKTPPAPYVPTCQGDCAQFVSQSVPSSVTAGQNFTATITLRNVGTEIWGAGTHFLGSQNPQDSTVWVSNARVTLPKSVIPGEQVTITVSAKAPTTTGARDFQWRMVREYVRWFGDTTPNVSINVVAAPVVIADNAQFVSQAVPTTVTPGQNFTATITMKNNGTTIWSPSYYYGLGSSNPLGNTTWGTSRSRITSNVNPDGTTTFTLNLKAPTTTGTYNFQWKMLHDGHNYLYTPYIPANWFGEATPNVSINVANPAPVVVADNAVVVTQSLPTTMTVGKTYPVSITMKNTGTTVWNTSSYYGLGSANPLGNMTWGLNRKYITSNVNPDGTSTFTFNVTAPAAAGTYNFQWRLLHDMNNTAYTPAIPANWFGASTPNVSVNVVAEAPAAPYVPTCQGDCAQFISQTVPTSVTKGGNFTASVTLRNTGTSTWGVNTHFVGSQNPQDNTTWLASARAKLPKSVVPGEYVTVTFTAKAPNTAGTYKFQWRMVHEFVRWFGDYTPNISVTVQ